MKNIFLIVIFIASLSVNSQEKDKTLPIANEEFVAKKYSEAEANYRISQSKAKNKTVASYNLGNSIYRQNQAGEAKYAYTKALEKAKNYTEKHLTYHNLGNSFMKEKNYSQAVEAYKNALRNNPADEQTRYNYALAKKMLKENPPKDDKNKDKNKDKDKDKNKNKDKDKDKKDGNKDKKDDKNEGDKDKEDKKEGDDKKDNGNPKDEPAQPKPKPGGISKERLENLLDAVNNEEKKVQEKMNGRKVKGKPVQNEKDW